MISVYGLCVMCLIHVYVVVFCVSRVVLFVSVYVYVYVYVCVCLCMFRL